MRRTLGLQFAIAATAFSFYATGTHAQTVPYAEAPRFTAEELDNLLAPVALYPDPILAQVLVAASYPEEVELAAQHLNIYGESGIDDQPWNTSVRAVARYAPVLNLMADRPDWTTALGQAYAEQPGDVMAAVQSLRSMARAQGNLVTTEHHEVVVDDRYIRILPAQPRVVYVPVYDPLVVYHRPVVHLGVYRSGWSFGVALPIGVWLSYDFDWRRRHIYYHGWDRYYRYGWIHRSRPFIVINNIYVSPRPRVVAVNRKVINRRVNYSRFDRYNTVHRQVTWERHNRGDARRANNGQSWDRNGRNDLGRSSARNPSWDRSGGERANDSDRRAVQRSTATPQAGRTAGQRTEPRSQTQRAPSWDRSGGRSAEAQRAQPRAQSQRTEAQRAQPRAQPQRTEAQRAQPRAQPQRTEAQRAQPRAQSQRTEAQRAQPRAQPQRTEAQRAQPRAQPQRTETQRSQPRAQSQRTEPQRAQARVQANPTRSQSSAAVRSSTAARSGAASAGRSNGGGGSNSRSTAQARKSK